MKILNLYAGIGGNRRKWGNEHEITAVEYDPQIAVIYKDLYPEDEVVVGDAHEYLLNNYSRFDFIWASPPCPTHSRVNYFLNAEGHVRYPDMRLYQEIIFLKHFFKGMYCIENVKSYYIPLVPPQESGRHYFWANFRIPKLNHKIKIAGMNSRYKNKGHVTSHQLEKESMSKMGFPDLSGYKYPKKERLLRNCVDPDIGLAIFQIVIESFNLKSVKQQVLFGT